MSCLILIMFAINAPVPPPSVALSGNYIIANCGADAEKVTNALGTLYNILVPAINDLIIARERPSAANLTFFKDVSSAQTVRDVLNNVMKGPSLPWAKEEVSQSPTAR